MRRAISKDYADRLITAIAIVGSKPDPAPTEYSLMNAIELGREGEARRARLHAINRVLLTFLGKSVH
jgi:hypothetical protein